MRRPSLESGFPDYEDECQRVLEPHVEMLLEQARAAGWDRKTVVRALAKLVERKTMSATTLVAEPKPAETVTEATSATKGFRVHPTQALRPATGF